MNITTPIKEVIASQAEETQRTQMRRSKQKLLTPKESSRNMVSKRSLEEDILPIKTESKQRKHDQTNRNTRSNTQLKD